MNNNILVDRPLKNGKKTMERTIKCLFIQGDIINKTKNQVAICLGHTVCYVEFIINYWSTIP